MTQTGPVQRIAVGFGPEANFEGRILGEIAQGSRTSGPCAIRSQAPSPRRRR
jgi:hypothetical protein